MACVLACGEQDIWDSFGVISGYKNRRSSERSSDRELEESKGLETNNRRSQRIIHLVYWGRLWLNKVY